MSVLPMSQCCGNCRSLVTLLKSLVMRCLKDVNVTVYGIEGRNDKAAFRLAEPPVANDRGDGVLKVFGRKLRAKQPTKQAWLFMQSHAFKNLGAFLLVEGEDFSGGNAETEGDGDETTGGGAR